MQIRRPSPWAFFAASAVLGALALTVLYAIGRLSAGHPDVVYTLTPNPSTGSMRVEVEMYGLSPGHYVLLLPEEATGASRGPAEPFGATSGEPLGARLWAGVADLSGRASLHYDVRPEATDPRKAMLVSGARTFAIPVRSDDRNALFERGRHGGTRGGPVPGSARRIAVRFRLPVGWDAYTPWGEARTAVEVPDGRFARLREAIIAIGDYVPRHFEAAGVPVEMVTRGVDPAREDSLEILIRECLNAHERQAGPLPHENLLVAIDHPFRGDQASGETALNAACLRLSRDPSAMRSRSLSRVVAHELFHFWNGGAVNLDAPDLRWFAEGVTEYYGLRALSAAGRLSAGDLVDELAGTFDRLSGNVWADSSMAALGIGYSRNAQAWSATYAKGLLAAWTLDLRLARVGGLDALMRDLVRRGGRPDLRQETARLGAGDLSTFLDSLSHGMLRPALETQLASRGLWLERRPTETWTLGLRFFRPGTTEVMDLDPDGPAARLGVRVGDRVVAVNARPVEDLAALAEALSDAHTTPIVLLLWRRGRPVRVAIDPERALATVVGGRENPAGMASQHPAPGELKP